MNKHIAPNYLDKSFHCPHCGILSEQTWSEHILGNYLHRLANGRHEETAYLLNGYSTAKCRHCDKPSIWFQTKMVYPHSGIVELANQDLPESVLIDFNEARDIVNISPRGAAALLRLAIQKLCIHLGEKGKNINSDISNLVKKGLPESMQQALDSVRVIGNNAVHPGTIDLNDNTEIAYALFGFVNVICEMLISQPKKIKEFYDQKLPAQAKAAIENRDKK